MPISRPVARDRFISAMRQVASSVTVVTTDGPAGRHGATVSAFNSLSADPPSVLICLRADSRIARAVTENARYCVNILPEDRADMAGRFAGAQDRDLDCRFDGVDLTSHDHPCPALAGATAFHCDLGQSIAEGSHLILVGHVTEISSGISTRGSTEGSTQTTKGPARPLTYLDGRFHRVRPH